MVSAKRKVWENEGVIQQLLDQKTHYDKMIDSLVGHIKLLERALEIEQARGQAPHCFFTQNHPELIPEYVRVAFEKCEFRESALAEVDSFHDETFDLSTLPETKNDFKPW